MAYSNIFHPITDRQTVYRKMSQIPALKTVGHT